MAQRQVHIMIGGGMREVDPKVETDRAVNHHGKNGRRRADQLDVGPSDMCGHEQAAGSASQRQSDPLEHMRRAADRRAGVPWGFASDNVLWTPSQAFASFAKDSHTPAFGC